MTALPSSHSSRRAQGHFLRGVGSENRNPPCGKILAASLFASRPHGASGGRKCLRGCAEVLTACQATVRKHEDGARCDSWWRDPMLLHEPRERPCENEMSSISAVAAEWQPGSSLAQKNSDSFHSFHEHGLLCRKADFIPRDGVSFLFVFPNPGWMMIEVTALTNILLQIFTWHLSQSWTLSEL